MIELNLIATNSDQELVKTHLQEMVSEVLAEKINNGVYIEKDGKRLLNKKDLNGFVEYAYNEAQKLLQKGEKKIAINGDKIMSWCIHYFEEDDIIGTLYNEDGTEYKPKTEVKPIIKPIVSTTPPKPQQQQTSFFELLNATPPVKAEPVAELAAEDDDEPDEEEIREALAAETDETESPVELPKPKPIKTYTPTPMYQSYTAIKKQYADCLLLYRLGDFYEALSNDAVKVAELLNLTLTSRDCGLESRVPMCGIPYHAVDAYISKLVEKGYKVALAEDLSGTKTVRVKQPEEPEPEVDEETGEILSESEMRLFDGQFSEPPEIDEPETDELADEKEFIKAFDSETIAILSELFDGEINIA
jgi:hypothetical protein